jgi:hypothetical protein
VVPMGMNVEIDPKKLIIQEKNMTWLWQITNIVNRSYDSHSIDKQLAVQVVAAKNLDEQLPYGSESIFTEETNQHSVITKTKESFNIEFALAMDKWVFDESKNNPIFNVVLAEVGRELAKRRNSEFFKALDNTAGHKVESEKEGELTKQAILQAVDYIKEAGFTPNTVVIPPNQESNFKKIKEENKSIDALNNLAVHYIPNPENLVYLFDKNQILMASTILQASFRNPYDPEPKQVTLQQKIKCSPINSKALVKIAYSSVDLKENSTHISK